MAERVGFEPTIPVKVCPLSRRIVSTTHAPLRVGHVARSWTECILTGRNRHRLAGTISNLCLLSSAAAEEFLQELCALSGENAAAHFNPVIERGVVENVHCGMHSAGLGVFGAVYKRPDAGVHHSSGAHGTWLNSHKQIAIR